MAQSYTSWSDIETSVRNLKEKIQQSNKRYDWIISINRGGVIPGVMLSHALGIPHGVLTVTHYDGDKMLEEVKKDLYISGIKNIKQHHNILLVDDIADSGICLKESISTIRKLDSDAKNIDTATIYYKPKSVIVPTFYDKEVSNESWVWFPWELLAKDALIAV
jgi:hypoxanthine phosphoribosyltransferase